MPRPPQNKTTFMSNSSCYKNRAGAQPALRSMATLMELERLDVAVIGAGVIGLAVARALAVAGREVTVLEAEPAIGVHTSARNSEVIHAGIYYPTGSLKARLCVSGKRA